MAILTSLPQGEKNEVKLYDIPDSELQKYALDQGKAAQMFPDQGGVSNAQLKFAVPLEAPKSEVQGYAGLCECTGLLCNAYVCIYGSCLCDCTSEVCL
jgi:hypothetical protein